MIQTWRNVADRLSIAQSGCFVFQSGVIVDSGDACLIDPGLLPDEIAAIRRFVEERRALLKTVVLTHGHWDHILGPEHLPCVKLVAQADFLTVMQGQQGCRVLRQIDEWETSRGIRRATPFALPRPTITFSDEMSVDVGTSRWRLIHASGHAPDHLVVYEPKSGTLWAADMLSELEIPYVCHSLVAYRETLDRLSKLETRSLVPAHGYPASDTATIRARFDQDADYLEELHGRVSDAIRNGRTIAETVSSCEEMMRCLPEGNERPHRMNVESAFVELGGESVSTNVGWRRLVQGID